MQDFEQLKQIKAQCLSDIQEALPDYVNRLNSIDTRLLTYIEDAISNNASHANLYELLGIRKEMRLMDSYDLDPARVQRSLRAIEGQWRAVRHVKGGLKFSTPRGSQHVRLMPFQAWLIFCIYAFKVDVDMEREYHEGDILLPTEWVKDGEVWDTRRLTQEAHWFITRKSGKTELGAAVDFVEACFLGDVNGQVLICAPSAELSKISFKAVRNFAMQVDPTCSNRMGGKYFRLTKNELSWQPGHPMKGEIKTMAAGKTPKDGYYASVVQADEHGQPSYVNGHCDMQASVDTCWGSTGPRREKLLLHTTTAGRVKDGPYKSKIENDVEPSLLREMQYPLGQPNRTPDDYWCAFLLQLDKWEVTEDLDKLDDPELFKKVNRSIGTTVQPDYYRKDSESGEVIKQIAKTLLVCLAFALLGWLLSGCTTTKYVPVIEHQTDTLIQRVVERDSIHVHDSIRVTEKGDTIKIERWHTQYRDRWHHDSVYIARHDTVPQPYPVTEYVERKRTTFEWLLIIVGIAAIFGGILWLANKIKKYLII